MFKVDSSENYKDILAKCNQVIKFKHSSNPRRNKEKGTGLTMSTARRQSGFILGGLLMSDGKRKRGHPKETLIKSVENKRTKLFVKNTSLTRVIPSLYSTTLHSLVEAIGR